MAIRNNSQPACSFPDDMSGQHVLNEMLQDYTSFPENMTLIKIISHVTAKWLNELDKNTEMFHADGR